MGLRIRSLRRKKTTQNNKKITVIGHLAELRKRMMIIAAFFLVSSGISYNYVQPIVKNLIKPAAKLNFVYVAPPEMLLAYIKLSVIAGIAISSPVIFWEIWAFVKPGLKKEEKRYIRYSLFGGIVFFILGAVFSYFVILPVMMRFFSSLSTESIAPMISFGSYVDFVTTILVSFGLVFEMPIIIILLTRFGIIDVKFLTKNRKYIVLIVFIIAAIITPPDVVSQILLALPMLLLFEFSVFIAKFSAKKQKIKDDAAA